MYNSQNEYIQRNNTSCLNLYHSILYLSNQYRGSRTDPGCLDLSRD